MLNFAWSPTYKYANFYQNKSQSSFYRKETAKERKKRLPQREKGNAKLMKLKTKLTMMLSK